MGVAGCGTYTYRIKLLHGLGELKQGYVDMSDNSSYRRFEGTYTYTSICVIEAVIAMHLHLSDRYQPAAQVSRTY